MKKHQQLYMLLFTNKKRKKKWGRDVIDVDEKQEKEEEMREGGREMVFKRNWYDRNNMMKYEVM